MTLLFKLIWRDLRANPGRVAVSVFAILVSVSLIVWMMGSYDTLVKEFDNDAEAYMGSYDLCLVPEAPKGPLPPRAPSWWGTMPWNARMICRRASGLTWLPPRTWWACWAAEAPNTSALVWEPS